MRTLLLAVGVAATNIFLATAMCRADDAPKAAVRRPFGIEQRTPWTTSRIRGAPDPPLGPDLSEIGKQNTPAQLLESMLEPSKKIDPKYLLYVVETDMGRIYSGLLPDIASKYGHMLSRCFGSHSPNARPDVHHLRLQAGDQLLLCTDGLTDMVRAERIAQCLDESSDAQSACDGLIALALAAGGKDNVTVVLARAKSR